MREKTFCRKMAEAVFILWLGIMAVFLFGRTGIVYAASSETDFVFDAATGCVTEYTGSEQVVEVPDKISGVTVTGIEWGAFSGKNMTKVVLPDTIQTIGAMAFENCKELTSMEIPEKVTVIAPYTFYGCSALQTVVLPESVEKIMLAAFGRCSDLREITILQNVEDIEAEAFADCSQELTVIGKADSFAQQYAVENGINFREQALSDLEMAQSVIEKIEAIGEVTLEKETAVNEARVAYNALSDVQKGLVTNYNTLTAAEERLKRLAEDKEAADAVNTLIEAIDTPVTLASEEAIKAAREAYDKLTDTQKALVKEDTLTKLEEELEQLKNNSTTEQPGGSTTEQPGGSTTEQPTGSTTEQPGGSTTEQPTGSTTEQPGGSTTERPTGSTTERPTGSTTQRPEGSTTEQPGGNTTEQPTGNTTEQPTGNQEVKAENIRIIGLSGKTSDKIAVGKKVKLLIDVSPANTTNKAVIWGSSNTKYATVKNDGTVQVKKAGKNKTVKITATAADGSGTKATFRIKIMPKAVKRISLKASATTVKAGKKVKIRAVVAPSNRKQVNTVLKWSSSNVNYATVNKKGIVTMKKAGKGKKVRITAMSTDGSNRKKTVTIKIR